MGRRGRDFERAVHEFVRTLDANAEVLFDQKVPDAHTGTLRQVDVWVRFSLGGHIPISILVSCKDHRRRLDIHDIESFHAEILSTRAHLGILYARGGFSAPAIDKARALRIACCRLFDNAPPESPTELLMSAFVAWPCYRLMALPIGGEVPSDLRWRDIFSVTGRVKDVSKPIVEILAGFCMGMFDRAEGVRASTSSRMGPEDITGVCDVVPSGGPPFRLSGVLTWDWFEGTLDAFRLAGSLNVTEPNFSGAVTLGPIPLQHRPPSSTWRRCERPSVEPIGLRVLICALGWPTPPVLIAAMANDEVFRAAPWVFGSPTHQNFEQALLERLAERARGHGPHLTITFGKAP